MSHVTFFDAYVIEAVIDGKYLRASDDHPVWLNDKWTLMETLGEVVGREKVARISIKNAHTFISNGILSHNKIPTVQDR